MNRRSDPYDVRPRAERVPASLEPAPSVQAPSEPIRGFRILGADGGLQIAWEIPTSGAAATPLPVVSSTEVAHALGAVWADALSAARPGGVSVLLDFTRDRGWRPLQRVGEALTLPARRHLPWRVLKALAPLPAWRYSDRSILAVPHGDEIAAAVIELKKIDEALNLAKRALHRLMWLADYRHETRQGPAPWMTEGGDHAEALIGLLAERREHLRELLDGTARRRLNAPAMEPLPGEPPTPVSKPPRPQAWARLRHVAAALARAIDRDMPVAKRRRQKDRRLKHGELRADVLRRAIEIVDALYGVRLAPADLRSALLAARRKRDAV